MNELSLENLKNGPTDEERKSAQNQIAQSQVSLEKARKKKEDYQIIASFDGTVTATNGKIGEISTNSNSSNSTATSITVEVPGLYQIDVLVDQLDVVKVRTGQDVLIRFDSYPGETWSGSVDQVDPTPFTSQGVVSYKAKILFRSDSSMRLFNSMTATVTIVTEKKETAISIPTIAISRDGDKKTVRVWENGRIRPREVMVGITDGTNTEILSGITIGERIVNQAFKLTTASGSNSGFSLFGGSNRATRNAVRPGN